MYIEDRVICDYIFKLSGNLRTQLLENPKHFLPNAGLKHLNLRLVKGLKGPVVNQTWQMEGHLKWPSSWIHFLLILHIFFYKYSKTNLVVETRWLKKLYTFSLFSSRPCWAKVELLLTLEKRGGGAEMTRLFRTRNAHS